MVKVTNIKNNGRKKVLVLGNTGDGKSTLCNILSGFDPGHQDIFPVSGGALSCTQETKFADVFFNGDKEKPISLIDTIGWSDSGNFSDAQIIEELISKLKQACDHVSLFLLTINGENPRITNTNIEMFKTFLGMFPESFLDQVLVVFTRWSMAKKEVTRRERNSGQRDEQRARNYVNQLKTTFGLKKAPQFLIIDALYDEFDEEEKFHFTSMLNFIYQKFENAPKIPTVNVEKVKTENMKLKNDLAKYTADSLRLKEEISRKAREQETQEAKAREQRKRNEETLQAMREREKKRQEEYDRRYGAQGPNAAAYADGRGVRAEACVGEAWAGDPVYGVGARGPAAAAGISDRGLELGAHAGEVTAGGFSARAGFKVGASDGQIHLGPVSAPCSIQ